MVSPKKQIRESKADTPQALLKIIERSRRKASRLKSFGTIPEESADRILDHLLLVRKELIPVCPGEDEGR